MKRFLSLFLSVGLALAAIGPGAAAASGGDAPNVFCSQGGVVTAAQAEAIALAAALVGGGTDNAPDPHSGFCHDCCVGCIAAIASAAPAARIPSAITRSPQISAAAPILSVYGLSPERARPKRAPPVS